MAAAILFGVSPPFAKLLLPDAGPLLTAGLLYLGAGGGLLAFELFSSRRSRLAGQEAQIQPADRWVLAVTILLGGIVGPLLMLWGLHRLSAVMTALLLNLEAPFTILVAIVLFREHLGRSETAAITLIIGAALLLHYQPGALRPDLLGFLAVVGACLAWAVDNNLSQRLSLRDPLVVTRIKALGAGACTTSAALLLGQSLPGSPVLLGALLLGFFSYGVSLVLDMQALRLLGAAREAGFFATAPFVGAVAAVPLLGEHWGAAEFMATGIMAVGVAVLFRAHHRHLHLHDDLEHDHAHVHDDHHRHEHAPAFISEKPHAHPHRHLPLVHDHPHVSDLHHRHDHDSSTAAD